MNKEINEITEAFLKALTIKEQAEQAHEEARQLLIAIYAKHGISENDHAELNVKVVPAERRSFDADKLRDLISAPLFRAVTKASVDTSAWDKAVKEGKVPNKVIKAVVTISDSIRVLVKPAKGAVKPASRAKAG